MYKRFADKLTDKTKQGHKERGDIQTVNVARNVIDEDRHRTVKEIEERVHISKFTVQKILSSGLNMYLVSAQ